MIFVLRLQKPLLATISAILYTHQGLDMLCSVTASGPVDGSFDNRLVILFGPVHRYIPGHQFGPCTVPCIVLEQTPGQKNREAPQKLG